MLDLLYFGYNIFQKYTYLLPITDLIRMNLYCVCLGLFVFFGYILPAGNLCTKKL